jgi:hypothetical protein
MAEVRNLAKGERIIRSMVAGLLIVMGFYLYGFWRPFVLFIGLFLLFTVFFSY